MGNFRVYHAIGVGFVVGVGGSIIGLATNPEYHLNIGHNDWQIKWNASGSNTSHLY